MEELIIPENPPNVLMVDDTPANLELLSVMLKGRGYKVRAAVSGKLALQAALNEPPDLILLDINMPEMDGYEVCAKLKSDERLKNIPVIFLSALSETIDKVKAFGAGGVDYITKPFQFEEVEARVATHLELRRQTRKLQEAYDKLSGLEKLRDTLVHLIIHDLRSPLAGIYSFLEIIKESAKINNSENLFSFIDEATKSAEKMIRIVSDVLDASKLEGGQMELNLAECELSSLLESSIAGLRSVFTGREIRYKPPEKPAKVLADSEIISRVIRNLITNAIRSTQKNGGLIRLGIQSSGGRTCVTVEDNGPGIAPGDKEKIFKKFAQVELTAGQQKYAAGLGLTFCKLAVEAHGGSIGVDSEEGKGSSFWFELPANSPLPRKPLLSGDGRSGG